MQANASSWKIKHPLNPLVLISVKERKHTCILIRTSFRFLVSCTTYLDISISDRHQCQLHDKRSLVNFESMSHAGGRKTSQPLQNCNMERIQQSIYKSVKFFDFNKADSYRKIYILFKECVFRKSIYYFHLFSNNYAIQTF